MGQRVVGAVWWPFQKQNHMALWLLLGEYKRLFAMSNGSALCGLQKMLFGGLGKSSDANNHCTQLCLLDIVRDTFEKVFVSIDALFKENVTLANRVLRMWARPGLSRSWSTFVVDLVTLENDVSCCLDVENEFHKIRPTGAHLFWQEHSIEERYSRKLVPTPSHAQTSNIFKFVDQRMQFIPGRRAK